MYRERTYWSAFAWLVHKFASLFFSHRQLYSRRRGSVQFFEFTPTFQLIVTITALAVSGWVAYASVTTVYSDQMLWAKENRITQQDALIAKERAQARELIGSLLRECKLKGCDIASIVSRSQDPTQTQSVLALYGAATHPKKDIGKYEHESSINPLAWSWWAIHFALSEIQMTATNGKRKEVSDETVLGTLVAVLWATLAALWFVLRSIITQRFRTTKPPSYYGMS